MQRFLKGYSVFVAFCTYIILLMGALVTTTGSGDGCGQTWPFCHGEILPSYVSVKTMIEYSHRIVSAAVGLFVVLLAIWAWRKWREDRKVHLFAASSVFFIVLQGGLGAAAVVWGQSDAVMALHFGFSLLCFASVALLSVRLFQLDQSGSTTPSPKSVQPVSKGLRYGIWGLAVYTYVVVYTGAYVRHTSSAMGCSTFPHCKETWIPDFVTHAGIQWMHRLFSYILLLFVAWMLWTVVRHYRSRDDLRRGSVAAFVLICLQALSGALIVLTPYYLILALTHTTIVSAFFAAITYLCMQVGVPWQTNRSSAPVDKASVEPALQ